MSSVDDTGLYKGGNLKAMRSWDVLRFTLSRKLPPHVHAANRLAQKVKNDPAMRKRGR